MSEIDDDDIRKKLEHPRMEINQIKDTATGKQVEILFKGATMDLKRLVSQDFDFVVSPMEDQGCGTHAVLSPKITHL